MVAVEHCRFASSRGQIEVPLTTVAGQELVLRDQGPLLARKDLATVLDGVTPGDWVRLLNARVYLFTDKAPMDKMLSKYLERDGCQDVITFSPLRLFEAVGDRLELAAQNSGAVARTSTPYKSATTFVPLSLFPDRKPAEVTIRGGLDDLSPIVRAERCYPDGTRELLDR
ncbi:MAG: DUF7002 family protein [Acidimicrobiales bacterium]